MRTLSLAPISGRRHPAGPMLMWVGPSVLAHVIVIALSGFRLTTTAEPESHPIIEAIFLAPLLPREDAHVPADATNGPGGTPFGWTDYTSVATADG